MANTIFVGEKYFCQDGFFREKKHFFHHLAKIWQLWCAEAYFDCECEDYYVPDM